MGDQAGKIIINEKGGLLAAFLDIMQKGNMEKKNDINTIDVYISQHPLQIQEKLNALKSVIEQAAPNAQQRISYQMPTYSQHGNLVHFAVHQKHIGFYPGPSGVLAFEHKLTEYKTSKGAVQFPLDKSLPLEIIKEIVIYRVAENVRKAQNKKN